jgi:hypothetical protein
MFDQIIGQARPQIRQKGGFTEFLFDGVTKKGASDGVEVLTVTSVQPETFKVRRVVVSCKRKANARGGSLNRGEGSERR